MLTNLFIFVCGRNEPHWAKAEEKKNDFVWSSSIIYFYICIPNRLIRHSCIIICVYARAHEFALLTHTWFHMSLMLMPLARSLYYTIWENENAICRNNREPKRSFACVFKEARVFFESKRYKYMLSVLWERGNVYLWWWAERISRAAAAQRWSNWKKKKETREIRAKKSAIAWR